MAVEREILSLVTTLRGVDPQTAIALHSELGCAYESLGMHARALELQKENKAISEEVGHRAGAAEACSKLGSCYRSTGQYVKALTLQQECKAICEELGDHAGAAEACGNIGVIYNCMGEYKRASVLFKEHKKLSEKLGDRAGVAVACGNLGASYRSLGDYGRAVELGEEEKATFEQLGDRKEVMRVCCNLGLCHSSTGDYRNAVTYYKMAHDLATELEHEHGPVTIRSAMGLGVTLRLQVKADLQASRASLALTVGADVDIHSLQRSPELNGVRGKILEAQDLGTGRCRVKTATGRDLALKPANLRLIPALTGSAAGVSHLRASHSSAPACLEKRVQEAAMWLLGALALGLRSASLHLAHLFFDAGQEDRALGHLKNYLSWLVARGRTWCDLCHQTRGEDAPMLTCSGCRVARFCSAKHQKLASKSVACGGNLWAGRHKDICGLLGKWRRVEKDGVSPDTLRADLLAFLRQ